jgi:glutamate/aspartate transport system substrate-binding protein
MAIVTQLLGAMALSGSRLQTVAFLTGYSLVAVVGLGYLAWVDKLIGPNRIAEQAAHFERLLAGSATIERVKNTGDVNIGYRADQFPFSYETAARTPVGYTLDLCRRIVEIMRVQQGNKPPRFKMVALNPGNRVAMVANGTVDMECDLATVNPGRERQIAFLDPTFVGSTKIVVLAASRHSAVSDLAGKRLTVVAGSSNVQIASELNNERRLNMQIVPVKDPAEAIRMLETGAGDAYISSDILIYGLIARASQPDSYKVLDESLSKRTYGIMVRRQDTAFMASANAALREMVKSGEFETIYQRWFQSPVEPGGVNLKLPMSEALRERVNATKGRP